MPEITPESAAPAVETIPSASGASPAAVIVAETPQVASVPPTEAPTEPTAKVESAAPAREPTLLEKFDADQAAKDAPKAAEPDKEAARDEPKAEEKPVESKETAKEEPAKEAAPEPFQWEELAVPDGFAKRFDIPEAEVSKRIGEFNDIITKDANPNVKRAELLALHTQAMQDFADNMAKNQANAWNEYNKNQVLATMADAELGGAGHNTAMGAVARVRDEITRSWSKGQKQQLNEFLIATGAGSHPAFLRLLHSAAGFIDEPQSPNITPAPTKETGLRETGKGGRRSVLYDNTRSP